MYIQLISESTNTGEERGGCSYASLINMHGRMFFSVIVQQQNVQDSNLYRVFILGLSESSTWKFR